MTYREKLEKYIEEQYPSAGEHPWESAPDYTVFRHLGNRKWFALLMNISRNKIGLEGDGNIDILNVKCDPLLIGSLLMEKGFFPAYHMNKSNWITISLDGEAEDEKIKWLIEKSFEATAPKKKARR